MAEFANDIFPVERFGLITGSKVSVLFPKKSAEAGQNTYARQLANQIYFKYYDEVGTWQTEHGQMNEHLAMEHYIQFHQCLGEKPGFIIDEENQLGGSPDFVATNKDWGVDFKCPTTLENWTNYLHDGIDSNQYYQAQHYMHLTGKSKWFIAAYLTETLRMMDNGFTYPVPEDKRMILIEVEKEFGWSDLLLERAPVLIKKRNVYLSYLRERFGNG